MKNRQGKKINQAELEDTQRMAVDSAMYAVELVSDIEAPILFAYQRLNDSDKARLVIGGEFTQAQIETILTAVRASGALPEESVPSYKSLGETLAPLNRRVMQS